MMRMFSRVDTGTAIGTGMGTTGIVGEIAKNSTECAVTQIVVEQKQNLMDLDVFFGLMPVELNITGALALSGGIVLLLSFIRGKREQRKREEKDK